jgi:hypothetical protein
LFFHEHGKNMQQVQVEISKRRRFHR